MGRGPLYWLLRNPIYIGRIKHREDTYKGQHKPIIDKATWDAVQQQLNTRARFHSTSRVDGDTHFFRGRIFDQSGQPLHATKSSKKGRHYFYYTSRCLMAPGENKDRGWRVPAKRLDISIVRHLARVLGDPIRLSRLLQTSHDSVPDPTTVADRSASIAAVLEKSDTKAAGSLLELLVERICLMEDFIQIVLCLDQLPSPTLKNNLFQHTGVSSELKAPSARSGTVAIRLPIQLERRSSGMRIVINGSPEREAEADPALVELVAQAHRWHQMLGKAEAGSIREISVREKIEESEISRVIALSSLAPDIVEAILDGDHPPALTANSLRRISRLPLDWTSQRKLLGFQT